MVLKVKFLSNIGKETPLIQPRFTLFYCCALTFLACKYNAFVSSNFHTFDTMSPSDTNADFPEICGSGRYVTGCLR